MPNTYWADNPNPDRVNRATKNVNHATKTFTTDGIMVETSLDYIHSDQPLAIDVPLLGGKK